MAAQGKIQIYLEDWKPVFKKYYQDIVFLLKHPSGRIGLILLTFMVIVAIMAPVICTYGPTEQNWEEALQPPSLNHLFGTDQYGRDVFSRVIYGARISLSAGFSVVAISAIIGIVLGAIAGYVEGWLGEVIMRLTDLFLAFPGLLLALLIAATLGPSLMNVLLALVVGWWPWYARLVQAQVLSTKQNLYVEAAIAMGASLKRIVFKHVLLNSLPPVIVQITMDLGYAILATASLSFIGLGAQPPTPEWGVMVSESRLYMLSGQWWLGFWPGLFLTITVIGFMLLGDGFNDLMNPRR